MSQRIVVRDLTRSFGETPVLRGVNLAVNAGEIIALYGPSGSGKTTLLNLISTLDMPTKGEITVCGTVVSRLRAGARAKFRRQFVGFIFQSNVLLPSYTALENIDIALRLKRLGFRERMRRAHAALASVGLAAWSDHLPEEMSGGQQQRVSIARALALQPAVILADEPTSGLDTSSARHILRLFREVTMTIGTSFLIVSHDPLVMHYVDTTYNMVDGTLVQRTQATIPQMDKEMPL